MLAILTLGGTAGCSWTPLAEWFAEVTSGVSGEPTADPLLGTDPAKPRLIEGAVGQQVVQAKGSSEQGPFEALWWEWTPPESGSYTFATHSSEVDTALVVYSSVDGVLTEIATNDDSGDVATSDVTIAATKGEAILVRVEAKDREPAAITLSWYPAPVL